MTLKMLDNHVAIHNLILTWRQRAESLMDEFRHTSLYAEYWSEETKKRYNANSAASLMLYEAAKELESLLTSLTTPPIMKVSEEQTQLRCEAHEGS